MTPTFRPMSLGEILDRTFQIYRARFLVFLGIAALPALAMMCLQTANLFWWKILPEPYGPRFFGWLRPQDWLYSLALAHGRVFFSVLLWPAYAVATAKTMFAEPINIAASLSACLKRTRSWIGLAAASWSLQFLLPELVIGGSMIGIFFIVFELLKANPDDPYHMGPLSVPFCIVLGWAAFQWIGAKISLSAPAWAIESLSVRASLRRGRGLSKDSRLRLFLARLAPQFLSIAASALTSRLLLFLRSSCDSGFQRLYIHSFGEIAFSFGWCVPLPVFKGIAVASDAAIFALLGPIYPIALTLFYYDQRIRHEGFDIEQMMTAAGLNPTAAASAPAIDAPLPDAPFSPPAPQPLAHEDRA